MIQIEVTTRCNFDCYYCIGRSMLQGDMSMGVFNKIIRFIKGSDIVHLQGEGEPILSKNFWEMTNILSRKGCYITTTTNLGYRLTSRLKEKLYRYYRGIEVSLDGVTSEGSEQIGRHKFELVISNLKEIVKDRGGDYITIRSIDFKDGNRLRLEEFVKGLGIDNHVFQDLMDKDDYIGQSRIWNYIGKFSCDFIKESYVYYDINGVKLPCCFIKGNVSGGERVREDFSKGVVPTVCYGCLHLVKENKEEIL